MLEILTDPSAFEKQEQLYITLRRKEGRIYSDDTVQALPNVPSSHPLYKEWKVRKRSSEKLFNYLRDKNKPLDILEIGCGNGWLSHSLSRLQNSVVKGMDVNRTELEQADRVFDSVPNLTFMYGNIFDNILKQGEFDIVVFAASVHYFKDIKKLVNRVKQILKPGGEIHIIDSPFYNSPAEAELAKERTIAYYTKMEVPEMAQYYNHLTYQSLQVFHPKVTKPSFFEKLGGKAYFPWIIIS